MNEKETAKVASSWRSQHPTEAGAATSLMLEWEVLVAVSIHPTKVAVLEAMAWLQEPLSPVELQRMFAKNPDVRSNRDLSKIAYHVGMLVEMGAIEKTETRPVRGAVESFYFPSAAVLPRGRAVPR